MSDEVKVVRLEDSTMYPYTENMVVRLLYRNHRGELAYRLVLPLFLKSGFRSTEHHPQLQYILEVWDFEKKAQRSYSMGNVIDWQAWPPEKRDKVENMTDSAVDKGVTNE